MAAVVVVVGGEGGEGQAGAAAGWGRGEAAARGDPGTVRACACAAGRHAKRCHRKRAPCSVESSNGCHDGVGVWACALAGRGLGGWGAPRAAHQFASSHDGRVRLQHLPLLHSPHDLRAALLQQQRLHHLLVLLRQAKAKAKATQAHGPVTRRGGSERAFGGIGGIRAAAWRGRQGSQRWRPNQQGAPWGLHVEGAWGGSKHGAPLHGEGANAPHIKSARSAWVHNPRSPPKAPKSKAMQGLKCSWHYQGSGFCLGLIAACNPLFAQAKPAHLYATERVRDASQPGKHATAVLAPGNTKQGQSSWLLTGLVQCC